MTPIRIVAAMIIGLPLACGVTRPSSADESGASAWLPGQFASFAAVPGFSAVIVTLVTAAAVPGILPFLVLRDGYQALLLANFIQICLLFAIGFAWARHSGANRWRTGLAIVALGVALVGVSVMLGG